MNNYSLLQEYQKKAAAVNTAECTRYYCLCHGCHCSFKIKGERDYHLKNHHPSEGTEFECSICKNMFNTNRKLKRHETTHTGKYECTDCGKTFLQRCDLERHTKVHPSNSPFTCIVCKKGFSFKDNLTEVCQK